MSVYRTGIVSILCWLPLLAPPVQAEEPTEDQISEAIAEGIEFLRRQQNREGAWSYDYHRGHTLGMTALAGLALLENGVPRDDPAVRKAEGVVVELAEGSNQTYDLSLAILFLARAQPETQGPHADLIQRLGARLAAGQREGMWTYTVPLEEPSGSTPERGTPRPGIPPFGFAPGSGDNSNTQFALLGVWAAGRHGFDSNDALAAIDEHFRSSQRNDGGWGYRPLLGSTSGMTCAGLMGLAIAAARTERAERLTARAQGRALAADPVFQVALAQVAQIAREIGPRSKIYDLWSLERVCVALGLTALEGIDWYHEGATELLRRQQPNGGWPSGDWGAVPETCLALLFLRKSNLAFELDRVLRLPDPNQPDSDSDAEPPPDPSTPDPNIATTGDDDVIVEVRQADESAFPKITLDFEVKRPDGTPIQDATQEDFRVFEDGQEVEILEFLAPTSRQTRATTVVLVVDRSLSMELEDRMSALKQSVATFLKVMPIGSRVAVIAFGSDVQLLCPFTTDVRQVQEAVNALYPAGATRYYDAVVEAIEMLAPEPGRKAVLALTDGDDTFSQTATLDSTILAARRAGFPVHTLGLGSEDEIESDALRYLASETRGQYFSARESEQLGAIYEELAERLGQIYSLAYQTDRPLPDGTLRPVLVYYRASRQAGETAIFIPGMVVPEAGWSRLFLVLVAVLIALAILPSWLQRHVAWSSDPPSGRGKSAPVD